jgi:hypothetical protein
MTPPRSGDCNKQVSVHAACRYCGCKAWVGLSFEWAICLVCLGTVG